MHSDIVDAQSPARRLSFDDYGGTAPENYERYFVPRIAAPVAADLIEMARLEAGERVLDVACGTGIAARIAAERVAPAGSVAALDVNPGMLAVARGRPTPLPIAWHEGRAESMPLPDSTFDVVLSQFSLQFFADKDAALREMRRVLVSGGRIAVNVPAPTPALFAILEDVFAEHVSADAAAFVRAVFSLRDEGALRRLVESAGFAQVALHRSMSRLPLPSPVEFLWQYVWSTPLVNGLAKLDPRQRRQLEDRVLEAWTPFVDDRGSLILDLSVTTVSARRNE